MSVQAPRTSPLAGLGVTSPVLAAPMAVIQAGAQAVMVGTALLRTPESGASAAHQAAVADGARGETVLTRSFSGRPARAALD
jgi:nitronate monooxygenase